MATNPRKFSEKIALHNQKQAEETAAFEQIMKEVGSAKPVSPRVSFCNAPLSLSPTSRPAMVQRTETVQIVSGLLN